jgi:hypothetical protein
MGLGARDLQLAIVEFVAHYQLNGTTKASTTN